MHAVEALAAPLLHWSVARVLRQGGLQYGLLTVHVLNILQSPMHVLQEPVLVFGSFDWACTGQEPAQAGSSVAGEAAQHDDDVPLKVAAAEAVAVARKVAQQGACDLPTLAAKRSVGLQVLKVVLATCQNIRQDCRCIFLGGHSAQVASYHVVSLQVFQEQKGAVAREALVVEGNALATEVVQQEDVADVKAAQEMLAVKAHCSEEEAAIEVCREQEAVSEAAQEATGDPAERTTEALEVTRTTRCSAPVKSNLVYRLSCWLHAELGLLSYPYSSLISSPCIRSPTGERSLIRQVG